MNLKVKLIVYFGTNITIKFMVREFLDFTPEITQVSLKKYFSAFYIYFNKSVLNSKTYCNDIDF